jgi:integrin alpha FG-GAP repeat containing protein 1
MRLGQLALLLGLVQGSAALWPFKPKRFTAEAFIDAGPLGLDDAVRGRVLAIGDINGDQK